MSEDKETLPEGSQPKGENPEGDKSGGDNVSDSISLEDLNKTLGKEFKDVETAKKSLQDTQSYVGKKIEEAEPKEDPSVKEQLVNLQSQLNDS
ncbi:MAG: hypothetical protein GY849_08840, partial [Deltaproteobacteria bacterium]|nr:hypothetical protein [Deltaproteobacteria bacterium]